MNSPAAAFFSFSAGWLLSSSANMMECAISSARLAKSSLSSSSLSVSVEEAEESSGDETEEEASGD
jgi:hypothetical protein